MSDCPVLKRFFGHIDTRPNDYYLFGSIWSPLTIVAFYLILVFKVIPKFMEKRNPYSLRKTLIIYNIVQMILNAAIIRFGYRSLFVQKDLLCAAIDFTDSYDGRRELFTCYFYYLTKILDLLDTIFIVLKKNNRQVTFLHVFHHSSVLLGTWFIARYSGGGHTLWTGFFNCSIHVLMYGYYLLTAYDKTYKDVVALKKFITISQMIQLTCIVLSFFITLVRPCNYPKVAAYFIMSLNTYMLYLFTQYYRSTHYKSSKRNMDAKVRTNETAAVSESNGVDGKIKVNGKAH